MGLSPGVRGSGTRLLAARAGLVRCDTAHTAVSVAAVAHRHASSLPLLYRTGAASLFSNDGNFSSAKPSLLTQAPPNHEPTVFMTSPTFITNSARALSTAATASSITEAPKEVPDRHLLTRYAEHDEKHYAENIARTSAPLARDSATTSRRTLQLDVDSPSQRRQQWAERRDENYPPQPGAAPRSMRNENLESGRETGRPVSSDDGILHLRPSQMVYVLGGNLQATYLAHILSCVPKSPKVRLLLFSKQFAENWRREGSQVQILRPGQKVQPMRLRGEIVKPPPDPVRALAARARRGSYQSSSIQEPRRQTIIQNLIVTEACVPSIAAIARIKHRLDNNSTICLVQPGLGVVERLNELHFPYPETRPRYILAHMTHSLGYTSRPFSVAELGIGKVMLTLYTPPNEQPAAPARVSSNGEVSSDNVTTFLKQLSTPSGDTGGNPEVAMPEGELLQVKAAMIDNGLHLMYLLGVAPTLGTGFYRYGAFLQRKLPEMISQSASETIATVLDLPLGDEIMHNGEARALLQGLITEMIDVVRALPETHADPKLLEFVTSGQLERQVKQLLHQYDGNSKRTANLRRLGESSVSGSSTGDVTDALGQRPLGPIVSPGPCKMAIRTALGRRADVQFLNGYFVRRGREVGIACPMNEMAVRMVQARRLANQTKRAEHINIEGLASEDVREAAALSRAQSAQRRADAEKGIERAPEPIHSSPAGKFPWRRSTQDEEVDGSEFDADTTEDEGAVEAAALRDKPTPAGQSSVLA